MSSRTHTRRALLRASAAFGFGLCSRAGVAQPVEVPVRLQAELLAKVAAYDRNFVQRARERALVLILVEPGDAESERVGQQMEAELRVLPHIGGLPHAREIVHHSTRRSIAGVCRARGAAIVYVSAGLGEHVEALAQSLTDVSVLSVGASASYVPKGAVLGFDVDSGKPKLVVNLAQARRQGVAFKPELLKLARVIQ